MNDMFNNVHPVRALSPAAAVTDNTAQVCEVTDRQGYGSLTYLIATGALADADATFTVLVEDSDDNVTFAAVTDDNLLGTEALASFTFAADNKCFKIGYVGVKRYVRATITPANNTGNVFLAAIALLGKPNVQPTSNPPA